MWTDVVCSSRAEVMKNHELRDHHGGLVRFGSDGSDWTLDVEHGEGFLRIGLDEVPALVRHLEAVMEYYVLEE